jgi:hypothetical protein
LLDLAAEIATLTEVPAIFLNSDDLTDVLMEKDKFYLQINAIKPDN